MKTYLTLLIAFGARIAFAQEANFFTDKWKIQEVKTILKGGESILYHTDSLNNRVDYSFFEVKFANNGSYEGRNQRGGTYAGTWAINSSKDTISIDQLSYLLLQLNSNYLIMRSYSLRLGDTLGGFDTVATDFKMFSLPDLTTSLEEKFHHASFVSLFPNPTKDRLEVKLNTPVQEDAIAFRLVTTYGQPVHEEHPEKAANAYSLDLSNLQQGVYFMEILSKDGRRLAVKKVVKE